MLLLLELSSVFRVEGIVLAHGEQFEHRLCARGARVLALSNAFELAGSAEYAFVVDDVRVADRPLPGIAGSDYLPGGWMTRHDCHLWQFDCAATETPALHVEPGQ